MIRRIRYTIRRAVRRWWYRRVYLHSAHWQRTATAARKRAGGRCEQCRCKGRLDVHHVTYARLWREQPGDLVAVCRECHKQLHQRAA